MMHGFYHNVNYKTAENSLDGNEIEYEVSGRNTLGNTPEDIKVVYVNPATGSRIPVAEDSLSLRPEVREALPKFIRVKFDDQQPKKTLTFVVSEDDLLKYGAIKQNA